MFTNNTKNICSILYVAFEILFLKMCVLSGRRVGVTNESKPNVDVLDLR